jgi:EAL domain-containing protein (putative c-di-GMP-specific phosphodiesterase class I)
MPSEFVPLAEESRLIDRLGRWVLREACAQAARWRRTISTQSGRTMSVNLSPRQLSDPHLVEDVRHALWISGLPASSLVLEITESSLALPSVDAVTVLRQLKEIGVVLALDDFGTGYSSLGHLVNYPLDMVKIDKSFVEMINDTDRRAALLTAVLGVADALSLETTIEGIENISQLERVRALGCTRAQGYLLSEPLDADAATRVLSQAAIGPLRRSARYLVRPETPVAG